MDPEQVYAFLQWLDQKHDIALASDDWIYDGDDEVYALCKWSYTLDDVKGWLEERQKEQDDVFEITD